MKALVIEDLYLSVSSEMLRDDFASCTFQGLWFALTRKQK